MSSYICSSKHFNSIQNKISDLVLDPAFYLPRSFNEKFPVLDRVKYSQDAIEEEIKSIVDELRSINVLCVTLQYKNHYKGFVDEEIAQQMEIVKEGNEYVNLSLHGLYNALRCLNYQIEINHLEELRPLEETEQLAMFFLKGMMEAIAYRLIELLPEDKTCTWSID